MSDYGKGRRMQKVKYVVPLLLLLLSFACAVQQAPTVSFVPELQSEIDFTFQYPQDWYWMEREELGDYTIRVEDRTYSTNPRIPLPSVSIAVAVLTSPVEARKYYDFSLNDMIRAQKNIYPYRVEVSEVLIDGIPAALVTISLPESIRFHRDEEYIMELIWFTKNNKMYKIHLLYPVSRERSSFVNGFRGLVESIEFLEK